MFLHASKRSLASGALVAGLLLAGVVVSSLPVEAQVHGVCSNCHTMHNSQNGGTFLGNDSTPDKYLTIGGCVGCHTNSGPDTIKTVSPGPGESKIPIVYNMTAPSYGGTSGTSNTLAGGNFFWLTQSNYGQEYAHNVLTIPGVKADTLLTKAPGRPDTAGGNNCAGCHNRIDDCTSCHFPRHHAPDGSGVIGATGGWYRYLSPNPDFHDPADLGVKGIEDSDWEQTVSDLDHNEYNGCNNIYGNADNSMSNYCAGCHDKFHGDGNTNTASPWIRHPAHLALPADPAKEYRLYNTTDGSTIGKYSQDSPVARDPGKLAGITDHTKVTPGEDQVMCLSCHRPHGSPYKDLLRWPYQASEGSGGMLAHTNTSLGNNWGCFVCHTTKDNK